MSEPTGDKSSLDYQAPDAPDAGRSQWITDTHPESGCLVGCLLALAAIGAVVAGLVSYLSNWPGLGI